MNTFGAVIATGLAACLVASAGIYAVVRFEAAARRNSAYFASFAAGVLITVSILHLVPRSLALTDSAPFYVLTGLLGLYGLDRLLGHHGGGGAAAMIGIGLHSLLDGVIFAVTYRAGMMTGALSAAGMVLHEFPEGVIVFSLLAGYGYRRAAAGRIAFLVAGASTPAGALAAYPFVNHLDMVAVSPMLAAAGGALLYVGSSHLLPLSLEKGGAGTVGCVLAGAALTLLIIWVRHV